METLVGIVKRTKVEEQKFIRDSHVKSILQGMNEKFLKAEDYRKRSSQGEALCVYNIYSEIRELAKYGITSRALDYAKRFDKEFGQSFFNK